MPLVIAFFFCVEPFTYHVYIEGGIYYSLQS